MRLLVATKFVDGAWIIALAIPLLVFMFHKISQHYEHVADRLTTDGFNEADLVDVANVVIVPIGDVHRGTLQALQYACLIADDVRAVCVSTTPEMRQRVESRWARFPKLTDNAILVTVDYDFRDILIPLVNYIEHINHGEFNGRLITIVIPEFIPSNRLAQGLHNRTANRLRHRLRSQKHIVIIDVPYHIRPTGTDVNAL